MTAPDRVLLPDGARLVHIGPHKTGTTTLQGAFHLARRAAAAQGVHYAGPNRQATHAAQAIAAVTDATAPGRPALREWRRLMREIEAVDVPRLVVSSEWFADARPAGIRLLANDLDPSRVHVAVTLRPLGRILASQWQQFVQGGWQVTYQRWLESIFRSPNGTEGTRFWQRHAHDRLVERWAEIVGRDRVTVVVVSDRDRGAVLRAFERLTGLVAGTLIAPDDRGNRSLTAAEVELVRELHRGLKRLDVASSDRLNLVLHGVAGQLKQRSPGAAEARIETPRWAREMSAGIARDMVDNLRVSGVRVMGDLDLLAGNEGDADSTPTESPVPADWPAIATSAAIGLLAFSGHARARGHGGASDDWPDRTPARRSSATPSSNGAPGLRDPDAMGALSTTRLATVFSARVRGWLRDRMPVGARLWRRLAHVK